MAKVNVEDVKRQSDGLRGTIAEELTAPTERFGDANVQLLKFHGTYQQEDRDVRKSAREADGSKAYAFMVRTRNPGGYLPAPFYLAIDRIADEYGNGTVRVTTRQGLQLHGVRKTNLKATIAAINAHLGSTLAACGDVNRNVMAPPWPFAGPRYTAAREAARAIAKMLAPRTGAYVEIWQDGERVDGGGDEPIYGETYLPRKFKIAVTVDGDNAVDLYSNDIGVIVVAGRTGEVVGYNLVVGGGLGMTHRKPETFPRLADPLGFVEPHQLLDVARTIVTIQRDYGDRTDRRHARMKYLIAERGIDWFRREVEHRSSVLVQPFRPVGEWSVPLRLGWHAQGDGRWFYGLHVLTGRVRGALKSALREIVERFGLDLVATPQQNLLITGVPFEARTAIDEILRGAGAKAPDSLERNALACPALPTCGLALAESERALPALLDGIRAQLAAHDLADEEIAIRTTGCPNGCARPYLAEIGVVGTSPNKYNLYLGADAGSTRLNRLYRENLPFAQIPATLGEVFASFRAQRRSGERFGDWCDRALFTAAPV